MKLTGKNESVYIFKTIEKLLKPINPNGIAFTVPYVDDPIDELRRGLFYTYWAKVYLGKLGYIPLAS